jgi:hypothetical protein
MRVNLETRRNKAMSPTLTVSRFTQLRQLFFDCTSQELWIEEFTKGHAVFGIAMEVGDARGSQFAVSFIDGNSSIYFETGAAVIGGIHHPTVRQASQNLINLADKFVPKCRKTARFPSPKPGEVIFYIKTLNGIYASDAIDEDQLGSRGHPLSDLFYAAHELIGSLRKVSEHVEAAF